MKNLFKNPNAVAGSAHDHSLLAAPSKFAMTRWERLSSRDIFHLVCSLALVALFLATGCSSREEKFASFMSQGDQLMQEHDPVRAALEYKNALQLDPKNTKALVALGRAYSAQKEHRKAFGLYRQALELDPSLDQARIEVARFLALAKQGRMALSELSKLKDPVALEPNVTIVRARALMTLGDFKSAVDALQELGAAGANNKEAQFLLANAYRSLMDFDAMQAAVKRWRAIDPKDPGSYLFMAKFETDQGSPEQAAKQLQALLAANPDQPRLTLLAAGLAAQFGLHDQAKAWFEALPPEPVYLRARADFWKRSGNPEKAEQILEQLVQNDPADLDSVLSLALIKARTDSPNAACELLDQTLEQDLKRSGKERLLVAKASILADEGHLQEAKQLCTSILKENQGNMDAHLLIGKILLREQSYEEAQLHLSQVASARPGDPRIQIMLARSLFLAKKDLLGLDILEKALKVNPDSTDMMLEMVRYHLSRKEEDQAESLLKQGLDLNPDDVRLLINLGRLYTKQKRYDAAEELFRNVVLLRPQAPSGYVEMGRLLLAQKKFDDAIVWYERALPLKDGWQVATPALIGCYLSQKNTELALNLAQRQAIEHPDSPLPYYLLGKIRTFTGELDAAERDFLKASSLAPGWPEPYKGLADIYLKQGKIDKAVAQMEDSYKHNPKPVVGMNLAALYEYLGRYRDAVAVYEGFDARVKKSPDIMNNMAYLRCMTGNDPDTLSEASQLVASALVQQPENPAYLDTAAFIAYKQDDTRRAWDLIQRALQISPDIASHNLHAAMIAHARGDDNQSKEYLTKCLEERLWPEVEKQALALKQEWKM